MWESRLSGSERGRRTTMERMRYRTPLEDQMVANYNNTQTEPWEPPAYSK